MITATGARRASVARWVVRGGEIVLDRPIVIGILNVTPDSFSDGGAFFSEDAALRQAERMLAEGADVLDIGGESTRPRADPVSADDELRRVLPVLRAIHDRFPDAILSVDTVKSAVARQATAAGAVIVNDVSAMRLDSAMPATCAELGVGVVLMHSRGGVAEMASYARADYGDDAVGEIASELGERVSVARAAGISTAQIVLDPGIGFSKRPSESLAALWGLDRLAEIGFPLLVGVSRKRVIGEITGVSEPAERAMGSVGANVAALMRGARLFRVHDVAQNRQALDAAWAVLRAGAEAGK
jgi:dihydropteroate synthase